MPGTKNQSEEVTFFTSLGIAEELVRLLLGSDLDAIKEALKVAPASTVKALYSMESHSSTTMIVLKELALVEKTDRPNRALKSFLVESYTNPAGRRGILRTTHPNTGKPLDLYAHQCEAIRKLAAHNPMMEDQPRKGLLLLFHNMGLGKTTTGIATIAMAHMKINDTSRKLKALIISPIQVASFHVREALTWLHLEEHEILLARKQTDLTEEAISRSKIIVVTYSALKAALATFVWKNPRGRESVSRKTGAIRYFATFESLTRPRARDLTHHPEWAPDAPPPVHPIFAIPQWDITILDEVQHASNPDTWYAKACRRICSRSVNRVLGSGTPVRGKVAQMAGLFSVADCIPDKFQQISMWVPPKSGNKGIRRQILTEAHEKFVHRKHGDHLMVDTKRVRVLFDPFVGRRADGSIDQTAIEAYNQAVITAGNIARRVANEPQMAQAMMGKLIACVTKTEQFCGNLTLGHTVNRRWTPKLDLEESRKNPSEQIKTVFRLIKDRQEKGGHNRILVVSFQTAYHYLLEDYCSRHGNLGTFMKITGKDTGPSRDNIVKRFLASPKAVLCISSAGAEGLNLAPGCEVVISFGCFPWSPQELRQAEHRIVRLTQTVPVEIIEVCPRGQTGKLDHIHQDKLRLVDGLVDNNFKNYRQANDESAVWREKLSIAASMVCVNDDGNHVCSADLEYAYKMWQKEQAELPEASRSTVVPAEFAEVVRVKQLAYATALPPISFYETTKSPYQLSSSEDDQVPMETSASGMTGVVSATSPGVMATSAQTRALSLEMQTLLMDSASDEEIN